MHFIVHSMKRIMDEVKTSKPLAMPVSSPASLKNISTIGSGRPPILTSELFGGSTLTTNEAAASMTSSSSGSTTSSKTRPATPYEIENSICQYLKTKKGKKSYAILQTTHGVLHVELDSDIVPLTCLNFTTLIRLGKYNNVTVHRLIPNFMFQTGDPTGSGTGGSNIWGTEGFEDEFDERLYHTGRGILSMANKGKGSNKSQFFVTLGECRHLDRKHR